MVAVVRFGVGQWHKGIGGGGVGAQQRTSIGVLVTRMLEVVFTVGHAMIGSLMAWETEALISGVPEGAREE